MSERKRTLVAEQESTATKRSAEPVDYSNDYSPRSPSPIRSPSIVSYSPCASPLSPSSPRKSPKTQIIKKNSFEVPEKFLNSVSERIHEIQQETECNVYISTRITGLTRTVYLEGFPEDINAAIDRIDEIVTSSDGFIHQIATKHLKFGDGYSPRSPSPIRSSLMSLYSPRESPEKCELNGDADRSRNLSFSKSPASAFSSDNPRVTREHSIPSHLYGEFGSPMREKTIEICRRNEVTWHLPENESSKTGRVTMKLYGNKANVEKSVKEIEEFIENYSEEEIMINRTKVAIIIGKNGDMIKSITDKSGAVCNFDRKSLEDPLESLKSLRVTGTKTQTEKAKQMIQDLIGSTISHMKIPIERVSLVIGKEGSIIISICKDTGASVMLTSKTDTDATFKICGSSEQIAHAREIIQRQVERVTGRFDIPFDMYSAGVLGDEKIAQISEVTGAEMTCCSDVFENKPNKFIKIVGNTRQVEQAKKLLKAVIEAEESKSLVVHMLIPRQSVGSVIGKNGATLASICTKSGAVCLLKNEKCSDKVFEIRGTSKQVEHAQRLIQHHIGNVVDCIDIPFHVYAAVVGDNNEKVAEISKVSDANCICCPDESEDQRRKYIRIVGTINQVEHAKTLLKTSINTEKAKATVSYINVSPSKCGLVLGRRGAILMSIRNESGADCTLSAETEKDRIFEIRGTIEQIENAKRLIQQIVEERSQTDIMYVPMGRIDQVIGVGGSYINLIREQSGASIEYDPRHLDEPMKQFKVSGTKEQIEKAKSLIKEASDGSPHVMNYVRNRFESGMTTGPPLTPPPSPNSPLPFQRMPQFSFPNPYYSGPSNVPRNPYLSSPQSPFSLPSSPYLQYCQRSPFFPPR